VVPINWRQSSEGVSAATTLGLSAPVFRLSSQGREIKFGFKLFLWTDF
jgi:hypothetical protein